MSRRSLAIFLHHLLAGELAPVGPISDAATLERLGAAPPPTLQTLLAAQLNAMLACWPVGHRLRPQRLPTALLWVAAALNNAAWAVQCPDPRLLNVTLRLSDALPSAADRDEALAYHSLLRHLAHLPLAKTWRPVAQRLLERSPLTMGWMPRYTTNISPILIELLSCYPVQAELRNRWLALLPDEQSARRTIPAATATANAELGRLLRELLHHDPCWRPFILAFYEADCALQRRGSDERPTWPMLETLVAAARYEHDVTRRRHALRTLHRYLPLIDLMANEAHMRPYLYLDGRFQALIADALPRKHLKWNC